MTLPSSGQITLLQIYNEAQLSATSSWYNKGANIGGYRGLQWWQDNTLTGTFPSTDLSMSNFYSKRGTTPVTPGSTTFNYTGGNQSYTIPLYSVLTITIRAGGGGGGGGGGDRTNGSTGGTGGTSVLYFGSNYYAYGGTGGNGGGESPYQNGTAGAGSDGSPAGGTGSGGAAGGGSGYTGGAGGKNVVTFTNPISGGSGPTVGSSVTFYIGGGGGGGSGGSYYNPFPYAYGISKGNAGGDGYLTFSWS